MTISWNFGKQMDLTIPLHYVNNNGKNSLVPFKISLYPVELP